MKKRYQWVLAILFVMAIGFCGRGRLKEVDASENVSVTIPTHIGIIFQDDGTNSIDNLVISNQSQVPVFLTSIKIAAHNNWELVSGDAHILADTKQLILSVEGQALSGGENAVNIKVPETSKKTLNVGVRRGAWTRSNISEMAFSMEWEYDIGKKQFQLSFDGNGSTDKIPSVDPYNGDTVKLPVPTRAKYRFEGWEDSEGVLHNGDYVMPIGNVTLKAKWQWTESYAIYSADDKSLTFVRSAQPIPEGSIYNGKTATHVYSGMEDQIYTTYTQVPWIWAGDSLGSDVKAVEALDLIQPKSTSYWFFCMRYCRRFDLTKLDMSQARQMVNMFSSAGDEVTDSVTLIGLDSWDTSKVTNMGHAFRGIAMNASAFIMDNISGWNTSNVTSMDTMFFRAGESADWFLDCRKWDVGKVTVHDLFNTFVEEKVIPPKWVH